MPFRFRTTLALAAVVALGLLAAPSALAIGHWSWTGMLPGTPSQYGCLWYYETETCSGWNNWSFSDTKVGTIVPDSDYLAGFENYNTIRGVHVYSGQQKGTNPAAMYMDPYSKAMSLKYPYNYAQPNQVWACGITQGGCYF
jgi:hypothetical protein